MGPGLPPPPEGLPTYRGGLDAAPGLRARPAGPIDQQVTALALQTGQHVAPLLRPDDARCRERTPVTARPRDAVAPAHGPQPWVSPGAGPGGKRGRREPQSVLPSIRRPLPGHAVGAGATSSNTCHRGGRDPAPVPSRSQSRSPAVRAAGVAVSGRADEVGGPGSPSHPEQDTQGSGRPRGHLGAQGLAPALGWLFLGTCRDLVRLWASCVQTGLGHMPPTTCQPGTLSWGPSPCGLWRRAARVPGTRLSWSVSHTHHSRLDEDTGHSWSLGPWGWGWQMDTEETVPPPCLPQGWGRVPLSHCGLRLLLRASAQHDSRPQPRPSVTLHPPSVSRASRSPPAAHVGTAGPCPLCLPAVTHSALRAGSRGAGAAGAPLSRGHGVVNTT